VNNLKIITKYIVSSQYGDGYWQATEKIPTDSSNLLRHRILYTHQALRTLAVINQITSLHVKETISSGVQYLLNNREKNTLLYGLALLIFPLIENGFIQEALNIGKNLIARVDWESGFVELGRRRQSMIFDYLFIIDILLSLAKYDRFFHEKLFQVKEMLERLVKNRYKLGSDISNWLWYLVPKKHLNTNYSPKDVEKITTELLRKRVQYFWAPPVLPDIPKITPLIHTPLLTTSHIVINLSQLYEDIPSNIRYDLFIPTINWIIDDFKSAGWAPSPSGKEDIYLTSLSLRALLYVFIYCDDNVVNNTIKNFLDIKVEQNNIEKFKKTCERNFLFDKQETKKVKFNEEFSKSVIEIEGIKKAIEISTKCQSENDKVHPKVGAVIIKDNKIISSGYRGEINSGEHAEYTVLIKKSEKMDLRGATLITTLEPCTSRRHDKKPCAQHIIEKGIKKVIIGMIDPNPEIRGKGVLYLQRKGIDVMFFPPEFQDEVRKINGEFWNKEWKKYKFDLMRETTKVEWGKYENEIKKDFDKIEIHIPKIFEVLNKRLNVREIRTLCEIYLGLDYESLEGDTKFSKITSLIVIFKRKNNIKILLDGIKKFKPEVWKAMWKNNI